MKLEKTVVTELSYNEAIEQIEMNNEAIQALERLIGTYETYGNLTIIRPQYSAAANPEAFTQRKVA